MANCPSFEVLIKGSIPEALQRVRDAAQKEGLEFSGDTKGGNFSGSGIVGYYTVSANIVSIKITALGFPASCQYDCETLEGKVREFFRQ